MVVTVERISSKAINNWLCDVHYLHRPVVRSKLLGYAVFADDTLVGAALWATPHFTRKSGIFGPGEQYDKWEVLVLARMYLKPDSGVQPSWMLAEMLGRSGRKSMTKRRGWRLQADWLALHPPRFPANPFVPRLLMSWSDVGLTTVDVCRYCKQTHNGQHTGIIYAANGWTRAGETFRTDLRNGGYDSRTPRDNTAPKLCWTLALPPNPKLQALYGSSHGT